MAHDYRVDFNGQLSLQSPAHVDAFVFPKHAAFDSAHITHDAADAASDGHGRHDDHDHRGHHDHVEWNGETVGPHFYEQVREALNEISDLNHPHMFSPRFDCHVDLA